MKKAILIVDDDSRMAKTLVDILKLEGYRSEAVHSGTAALKKLKEMQFHILITDVKMPDMNGVDLFRKVKKIYPDLTVIMMTAYAADDIIKMGIEEGVKAVLDKPLDIEFLLVLISAI